VPAPSKAIIFLFILMSGSFFKIVFVLKTGGVYASWRSM